MAIRYTNLPDNKSKPFGGAYSVHDRELTTYRDETIRMFTVHIPNAISYPVISLSLPRI